MKTLHLIDFCRGFALLAAAWSCTAGVSPAAAQTTPAFTYQGRLTDASGEPVNGPTTLRFQLFSAATGPTSLAGPVTRSSVPVTDGLFTTDIDFGNIFQSGTGGWVEIAVVNAQGDATILTPRQRIAPAPLASGVAGLTISPAATGVDVDNTASPVNSSIIGNGTGGQPGYLYFQAGRSGRLTSVTMRLASRYGQEFFATVYAGQGLGGQQLGSVAQIVPSGSPSDFTLDFSGQNIQVVEGQTYTMSVLCGTNFAGTSQPAPQTGGVNTFGSAVNWWFRTNVELPAAMANARSADQARTAINATSAVNATNAVNALTAVTATTANTATTSQALNANAVSALNNFELRLRGSGDSNHGLGHFVAGSTFRNTGFGPDGPVLFGNGGGGLGVSQEGAGVVSLQWNRFGVSVPLQLSVGAAPPTGTGYRLVLPNFSGQAGQGIANAWVTYSSGAYKENVQTFADPLDTIRQLRGVRFDWKEPQADGSKKHDIGFIAEEVGRVLPDLVTATPGGGATGLDYSRLVPITVEAIKALETKLEKANAQNADLRARLERLERAQSKDTPAN